MVAVKQSPFASTRFWLTLLIGSSTLAAILLLSWIFTGLKEPSDRIAGLTLIATFSTSTIGAAYQLIQKKSETKLKEKDIEIKRIEDESLEQQANLILMALKEAGYVLSDEAILSLLNTRQKEQAQDYLKRVRDIEKYFNVCQEVALNLSLERNDEKLQEIAQTSTDKVLEKRNELSLESLGLTNEGENRYSLYDDIYLYLKVWLKNSIQYDIEMPDISRQLSHSDIYVEVLQTIREEYLNLFPVSGKPAQDVIRKFLGLLIDNIRNYKFS